MESILFHPYEMESLRPKHSLEWANDFLYTKIVKYIEDNKPIVLQSLRDTKTAPVFYFQCVQWKYNKKQENKMLRKMKKADREIYMAKKQVCLDEIAENCSQHSVWSPNATTSIRSVFDHTDILTRLNVVLGSRFDVTWKLQMTESGCRMDFDIPDPEYIVLDCTIDIEFLPTDVPETVLRRMRKCQAKYRTHFPETENVYILNQPVRRHLKFDD